MLYVVTGANGWLGRRVVRALVEGDAEMSAAGKGGSEIRALVSRALETEISSMAIWGKPMLRPIFTARDRKSSVSVPSLVPRL